MVNLLAVGLTGGLTPMSEGVLIPPNPPTGFVPKGALTPKVLGKGIEVGLVYEVLFA